MTPKNFYNTLTSKLQEQLGPEWTTELCTDILANNGKKKIVICDRQTWNNDISEPFYRSIL